MGLLLSIPGKNYTIDMLNVKIRAMNINDLPRVMEIEKSLFSSPWCEEMFLEEIKSGYAYVVVEEPENLIIAYICGLLLYNEFNITNIAVHSDFQRMGLAERLVTFIIEKLLKMRCFSFFLEVRESNIAAIGLYKKLGFKIIGKRKKYYNNPIEDALIMQIDFCRSDILDD